MLAAFTYTEPPFYYVLLGVAGVVALMVFSGLFRRIILGMFGGGVGAAALAWFVLGKGDGDGVSVGLVKLGGAVVCAVLGALACGFTGFMGKWIRRGPKG